MYKIPNEIDFSFLKGKAVEMICFNLSQIYIHFESSIFITIEGKFILTTNGDELKVEDIYPIIVDHGLLNLLEKVVTGINISNQRTRFINYF